MLPPKSGASSELNYCLQLANKKKYEETINCLEAFKSRHPGSEASAEADLLIADSYFRDKDYLLAGESYRAFLEEHPSHPKSDYAYYKGGLSYLNEVPKKIGRDQQYLDLAVKNLEYLVNFFPNSPYHRLGSELYRQARTKQAKKNFYIGRFYYKYGEYRASIPRFVEVVNHYPGLGFDEKSLYYAVVAYNKLNLKEQAQKALSFFEERYPQSSWLKKAKGRT